jgi:hypothetical protein
LLFSFEGIVYDRLSRMSFGEWFPEIRVGFGMFQLVKVLGDDSFLKRLQNGEMPNPSLLKHFAHVEAHALGVRLMSHSHKSHVSPLRCVPALGTHQVHYEQKAVDPQDPMTNLEEAMKNVNPPRDWSTGLLADKVRMLS